MQTKDIESIKKLLSEENKDFYANFIKYIQTSPTFSIKRDLSQKVIKTPVGDYVAPIIVSLSGKDTKSSMTFSQQKIGQVEKILISDSTLHIQKPSSLASNAVTSNTSKTPTTTKQPTTTKTPTTTPPTSVPKVGTPKTDTTQEKNL